MIELKVYVPGFSGFAAPEWSSLLLQPRIRAARQYAEIRPEGPWLDENDYMQLFEELGDHSAQRSEIARVYVDMFAIKLAQKLGIPHGLCFVQYECEADRIVASMPLGSVRWILEYRATTRGGTPEGLSPKEQEALISHFPGEVPTEAAAAALRRLDPSVLGKLLGEFLDIAAAAPRLIARRRAGLAFADSIDWTKLRRAVWALRAAKRVAAEGAAGLTSAPPLSPR
ncbi:hypothetical protein ACFQX9_27390 [Bradyrhizobium sp. GCM10028915]|uniref:hypothetical protein n=1 Tax=Bradyrhizobium sp. GCM10028915 TaxID=3273385 RepID=UPI003616B895